jgi:hypothetical protein
MSVDDEPTVAVTVDSTIANNPDRTVEVAPLQVFIYAPGAAPEDPRLRQIMERAARMVQREIRAMNQEPINPIERRQLEDNALVVIPTETPANG